MTDHQALESDLLWKIDSQPLQLSRLAQGNLGMSFHRRPPHRVLLGIRDEILRRTMYRLMTNEGIQVESSEDGEHLLQTIGDAILQEGAFTRPELIIADSTLAGCKGEDLRRALKELNWQTSLILLDNGVAIAHRKASSPLTLGPVDAQYLCDFSERLLDSLECPILPTLPVSRRRWFSLSDALRTITHCSNRVSEDRRGRAR